MSSSNRAAVWRNRAWHWGVAAVMALLAVVHTWPLALHLTGYVAGGPREDPFMNSWHLWWMSTALKEGLNPFFTPYLHHPLGAELYWHTLAPAKTAWGIVLLEVMRPETAYNLLLLSTFVTTGWASWLLLRDLLRRAGFEAELSSWAALAGACVFNFSRYHLAHSAAHLNLSALEGIPLYVLFFLRWMEQGGKKHLWALGAAALYTSLCDYYYLFYEITFSALYLLYARWRNGPLFSMDLFKDEVFRRGLMAAGVAGLACLPALAPLLLHLYPQPLPLWHNDSEYHADLVGFFLPDRLSAWLRFLPDSLRRLVFRLDGNTEENGYFLGYLTLAVAAYGCWRGTRQGRLWLWVGLFFASLSLGTRLVVAADPAVPHAPLLGAIALALWTSRTVRERAWGKDAALFFTACAVFVVFVPLTAYEKQARIEVPMPYLLFKHVVPFFGRGGMSVRFELLTTLAMAVFFAFAAAHTAKARSGGKAALGALWCLGFALIPNVEYLNAPMGFEAVPRIPQIFEQIRAEPKEVAVLADDHRHSQFEQISHGHPITFARLSRLPVREFDLLQTRLSQSLMFKRRLYDPVSDEEALRMREYLKRHRIKYYVNHTPHPAVDAFVTRYLAGEKVEELRGVMSVYQFKDVP